MVIDKMIYCGLICRLDVFMYTAAGRGRTDASSDVITDVTYPMSNIVRTRSLISIYIPFCTCYMMNTFNRNNAIIYTPLILTALNMRKSLKRCNIKLQIPEADCKDHTACSLYNANWCLWMVGQYRRFLER